jgi:proteasome lid subunit RPN8/RPN11
MNEIKTYAEMCSSPDYMIRKIEHRKTVVVMTYHSLG